MFVGVRIRNPQIVNNLKDVQKRITTKFPELSTCLISPDTFHITLVPPTHPLFENYFKLKNKEKKDQKKKKHKENSSKDNNATNDLTTLVYLDHDNDNQNNQLGDQLLHLSIREHEKEKNIESLTIDKNPKKLTFDSIHESSSIANFPDPVQVFESLSQLEVRVPRMPQNKIMDLPMKGVSYFHGGEVLFGKPEINEDGSEEETDSFQAPSSTNLNVLDAKLLNDLTLHIENHLLSSIPNRPSSKIDKVNTSSNSRHFHVTIWKAAKNRRHITKINKENKSKDGPIQKRLLHYLLDEVGLSDFFFGIETITSVELLSQFEKDPETGYYKILASISFEELFHCTLQSNSSSICNTPRESIENHIKNHKVIVRHDQRFENIALEEEELLEISLNQTQLVVKEGEYKQPSIPKGQFSSSIIERPSIFFDIDGKRIMIPDKNLVLLSLSKPLDSNKDVIPLPKRSNRMKLMRQRTLSRAPQCQLMQNDRGIDERNRSKEGEYTEGKQQERLSSELLFNEFAKCPVTKLGNSFNENDVEENKLDTDNSQSNANMPLMRVNQHPYVKANKKQNIKQKNIPLYWVFFYSSYPNLSHGFHLNRDFGPSYASIRAYLPQYRLSFNGRGGKENLVYINQQSKHNSIFSQASTPVHGIVHLVDGKQLMNLFPNSLTYGSGFDRYTQVKKKRTKKKNSKDDSKRENRLKELQDYQLVTLRTQETLVVPYEEDLFHQENTLKVLRNQYNSIAYEFSEPWSGNSLSVTPSTTNCKLTESESNTNPLDIKSLSFILTYVTKTIIEDSLQWDPNHSVGSNALHPPDKILLSLQSNVRRALLKESYLEWLSNLPVASYDLRNATYFRTKPYDPSIIKSGCATEMLSVDVIQRGSIIVTNDNSNHNPDLLLSDEIEEIDIVIKIESNSFQAPPYQKLKAQLNIKNNTEEKHNTKMELDTDINSVKESIIGQQRRKGKEKSGTNRVQHAFFG